MAPNKKRSRNQQQASSSRSSNPPTPPPPTTTITSFGHSQIRASWPKPEHQKIRLQRVWEHSPKVETEQPECLNRPISEDWDDYDTLFYNAWLSVEMKPTRLLDYRTIEKMGIENDVERILTRIGLHTFHETLHVLYPDLARQFLATCRVYYANERAKVAQEGVLTFMCKGVRYRITIPDLCSVYGFKADRTRATLTTDWGDLATFWSYVGTGSYCGRNSKQTDIRHPALRYIVRVLSNTLLCKSDPSKMRKPELILLHHGLRHLFTPDIWEHPMPCEDLNLGAVFAHHLCSLKPKAFARRQFESVGSLLTPLFNHLNIITCNASRITERIAMDEAHLKHVTWMKSGWEWVHTDLQGHSWTIKLPQRRLTDIRSDFSKISFQPDPSLLTPLSRRTRLRGSSSTAPPTPLEAEPVADLPAPPLLDLPELDFPEPPPGYANHGPTFRRYMVDTMRLMWKMLAANVSCARPPSQTRRRHRSPSPEPVTPTAVNEDSETLSDSDTGSEED